MPSLFGKRTKHYNPTSKDNFTSLQEQLKPRKSVSTTATRRLAGSDITHASIFRHKTLAGSATRTSDSDSDALPPPPPPYLKTSKGPSAFDEMEMMEKDKMPLDPYRFTELLLQAARDRDSASLTDSGQFPFALDDVGSGTRSSDVLIKAPPPTPRNHRSLSRPSRHHHQRPLGEISTQAAGSVPRALRASQPQAGVSTVQFPCVESRSIRGVPEELGGEGGGYRSLVGVSIAIMEGRGQGSV